MKYKVYFLAIISSQSGRLSPANGLMASTVGWYPCNANPVSGRRLAVATDLTALSRGGGDEMQQVVVPEAVDFEGDLDSTRARVATENIQSMNMIVHIVIGGCWQSGLAVIFRHGAVSELKRLVRAGF